MKKTVSILFFTLFLLGAIIFSFQQQKEKFLPPSRLPEEVVPSPISTNRCYEWTTPEGDRAALRIVSLDGELTGSFNWLPAEKDSKTGIFDGALTEESTEDGLSVAELWWHTKGEGVTATEQLFVQFDEQRARTGFGEMKDRGDGTFVYANLSDISYMPEMAAIACSEI
ncbi:hypothetical protein IT401_01790 [Candidatus Nomurabacteria bacterium]|nr:hypothetical protein [Candidatus Nomurabacteria bacterium]